MQWLIALAQWIVFVIPERAEPRYCKKDWLSLKEMEIIICSQFYLFSFLLKHCDYKVMNNFSSNTKPSASVHYLHPCPSVSPTAQPASMTDTFVSFFFYPSHPHVNKTMQDAGCCWGAAKCMPGMHDTCFHSLANQSNSHKEKHAEKLSCANPGKAWDAMVFSQPSDTAVGATQHLHNSQKWRTSPNTKNQKGKWCKSPLSSVSEINKRRLNYHLTSRQILG